MSAPAERPFLTAAALAQRLGVPCETDDLVAFERGAADEFGVTALRAALCQVTGLEPTSESVRFTPDLVSDVAQRHGVLAYIDDTGRRRVAVVVDDPQDATAAGTALGCPPEDLDPTIIDAPTFVEVFHDLYDHTGASSHTDAPRRLTDLLSLTQQLGASDVHVAAGRIPAVRVGGSITAAPGWGVVDQRWLSAELEALIGSERLEAWELHGDADAAITVGAARYRLNLGRADGVLTLAARHLPSDIPTMDDLGVPVAAQQLCGLERGLVLVTGPTGSGKTTTLAAMLSHIAATRAQKLITLEDPVEYRLPSNLAWVEQRELGVDFDSFPRGLRQALRQDPDVILVGELRDPETTEVAVQAAETGHLVFATVHTYDTTTTIGRLLSQFEGAAQARVRAQLAYVLSGVLSQTLCPRVGSGRVAAHEVLLNTAPMRANLARPDGQNQIRQVLTTSSRDGMQTMETSLATLAASGAISAETGWFKAPDKGYYVSELDRLVPNASAGLPR